MSAWAPRTADGIDPGHRLEEGHIGLASHALRVEAAGGRLAVGPGAPTGTVATVELPLPATVPGPTGARAGINGP